MLDVVQSQRRADALSHDGSASVFSKTGVNAAVSCLSSDRVRIRSSIRASGNGESPK